MNETQKGTSLEFDGRPSAHIHAANLPIWKDVRTGSIHLESSFEESQAATAVTTSLALSLAF